MNGTSNNHLNKHLIVSAAVCHIDMEFSDKIERPLSNFIHSEISRRSFDGLSQTLTTLLNTRGPTSCDIDQLREVAHKLMGMSKDGYYVDVVLFVTPNDSISLAGFMYALFFTYLGHKSVHVLVPRKDNGNLPNFPRYMDAASILPYTQSEFVTSNFEKVAKRLIDVIHPYHPFYPPDYLQAYFGFPRDYNNIYNEQLMQINAYLELRNDTNHINIVLYNNEKNVNLPNGFESLQKHIERINTKKYSVIFSKEGITILYDKNDMLPPKEEIN